MATVPVSDASVQPRPASPGYQDVQAPSAAFGALQAKSLENAGDSIQRASDQLGAAAVQIQAKNDAVARAQDLASYDQQGATALENLKTNPKLTDPATTQAFSQQLTDLMNQTVANHSGSPVSKAALAARLALARTSFTTQAAEMASQAQDTLVQSTVGKQLQPITAAAYNNPGNLMEYFKSSDGVVQDMTPALSESKAAALTNSGREEILKSALQGLIDRGQLDEAQRVMADNESLMTPDVQRYFESHITVAQVAQQKAGNDAQRILATATAVLGRAPTQDEKRALLGIKSSDLTKLAPSDIIAGIESAKRERGVKDWQATPAEIDAAYGIATKINPAGSTFGNSLTGRALQFLTDHATAFAAGLLPPDEDREYQAAAAIASKPQLVTNKDTGVTQQVTPPLPPFVVDAYRQRGLSLPAQTGNTVLPGQGGGGNTVLGAVASAPAGTSSQASSVAPPPLPTVGSMPGTLHTVPAAEPPVPQGLPRPLGPGEFVRNPDGSWSNEITATVADPGLNGGRPTVVPTLWVVNGKPYRVSEDQATQYAIHSGLTFPSFATQNEAKQFADNREANWQNIEPQNSGSVKPLWSAPAQATASSAGTTPTGHATIWELNRKGLVTGPLASTGELVQAAPGIGNFAGHQMTEARNYVELSARNLVTALQNNPHYAEGERKAIEKDLDILPRSFDNSDAYAARLIATDDALAQREKTAMKEASDFTLPVEARQAARKTAFLVQQFRDVMGVPPILTPEQAAKLPPGAPFRTTDGRLMYRAQAKAAQ